ncbi:MAG TPA: methionyl-tRNA formyltransferase [Bryobacteraceae bacterium]|nr:methionyl-tRNA formyltransferase [Bryobacteraceae bacterium]
MRIVFLGTPEFAVPSLEALSSADHQIAAVFTQPDRPKGRGNQLSESPVKIAAKKLGIEVRQPERIRRAESVEQLRQIAPDLMVVVGYGQIIPQAIIDIPRFGILNVHASLLPKYRGAAPIQWAIANGELETGVTIMQIDAGLDTGDMLLKSGFPITPDETAPELSADLAPLGAKLLIKAIGQIQSGTTVPEKQKNEEATYAPILKKEDGRIEWSRTARQIYNRLRGFTPWPGAYTSFRGQPLLITRGKPAQEEWVPQSVLQIRGRRLFAGCGENTVFELLEVQPAGKKRMSADSFLNGYKVQPGEMLGDVRI